MPDVITDVPLLAMSEVLFPGAYISLRLDNPAQRSFFRACNDNIHHIGVILTHCKTGSDIDSIPSTVGCLARIVMLIHEDEADAPTSVVLYGEKRLRLLNLIQKVPYLTGSVELVEETLGNNAGKRLQEALELLPEYTRLINRRCGREMTPINLPDDPLISSFLLAAALPVSLNIKQQLLEAQNSALRLADEIAFIRADADLRNVFLDLAQSQHHCFIPTCASSFQHLLSKN